MATGGMFGKYLRREHGFKRLRSVEDHLCYFKHSIELGGIYAFIEPGLRGVLLVVNRHHLRFEEFTTLSCFLGQLDAVVRQREALMKTLYRSITAKQLRIMAI